MSRSQMEKDIIEAEKKLDREKTQAPAEANLAIKIVRIIALVVLLGFSAAVIAVPWIRGIVR